MSNLLISKLIDKFEADSNPLAKHLRKAAESLTEEEMTQLNNTIAVFASQGADIEEQCAGYEQFLDMTIEETKYFVENGHYRYSSFAEVADKVYFDATYMKRYMIGIALSAYLWDIHKNCMNFFKEKLQQMPHEASYGEIGPGHGAYFSHAVCSGKFDMCTAIDVSPTSLEMTEKFTNYQNKNSRGVELKFICEDVNNISGDGVFDMLTMCEVLEHVEKPAEILASLRRLLKPGGRAYLSIPINAPDIDHIVLFETPEQVAELLESAGFRIEEQRLFCANNVKLARALKFKEAILMCVWLS